MKSTPDRVFMRAVKLQESEAHLTLKKDRCCSGSAVLEKLKVVRDDWTIVFDH